MDSASLCSSNLNPLRGPQNRKGSDVTVRDSAFDNLERTTLNCNENILTWLEKHSKPYFNDKKDSTFVDKDGIKRYLDSWMKVEEEADQHSNVEDESGVCKVYFRSRSNETRCIKFLVNWEKLWKSFEEDNGDEIAAQAPLLRIFIEFFFHERTCQLFTLVVFYDIFLVAMIALTAGNPLGSISTSANIFLQVIQVFIYWALKKLYTGYIMYDNKDPHDDDTSSATFEERHKREMEKVRLRKLATKKYSTHLLSTSKQLCVTSFMDMRGIFESEMHSQPQNKRRNYYNLINIALKMLSVHNEEKVNEINFNRPAYTIALLFVLVIVPIYVAYQYVYTNFHLCKFRYHYSGYCDFVYWFSIEMLGLSLLWIQYYIFISSIFVGFVGLAYGGEIAYQLTNSWLARYTELRRVEVNEDGISETMEEGVEAGGMLTDKDFEEKISRDAFEQHLFFAAYMKQAGMLWSSIIAAMFVYMMYVCAGTTYYIAKNPGERPFTLATNLVYGCVRFLVLFVVPITSLAHANRYVYTVRDTFMNSAPLDYSIIGGKDEWASFIMDVPAVWTLFGVWITWERILGVVWTLIGTAAAIAITMVTANLRF